MIRLKTFLALALLMPSLSTAATINFWSNDTGTTLDPGTCCSGAVTALVPHPVWGDVNANAGLPIGTADWISFANTGSGGFVVPNATSRAVGSETAMFQELLNISSNDGASGTLNLWILADDTATVTVTGPGGPSPLFTAFAGQLDPCAPGGTGVPIGCMAADIGIAGLDGLVNGMYTLNVYGYQTNEDVFGVQYAGNYSQADPDQTPEPVPEPATLALFGIGLFELGRRMRRARTMLGVVVACLISSVAWSQSVVVDGDVTINSTRPLIFPVEEGTPGNGVVHAIKLGGAAEEDIFISLHDAQPGTGQATNSRAMVLYSRQTTAAAPVAHSSLFLSGWWWDPAFNLPIQRAIELENKVGLNGQSCLWLEEIIGTTPTTPGSGKPFMRFCRTPTVGFPTDDGHIITHDQPGAKLTLDARDTNDGVDRSFITLTAGSTPSVSIAPPSGGTAKIRGMFFANDGSTGITKTCTRSVTAMTIKNGLITAATCQ